jgi:hypothetical protein
MRRRALVIAVLGAASGCERPGASAPPAPAVSATAPAAPEAPAAGPADGVPWFEERAAASGLAFTHQSGHAERFYLPEIMCGGAALFDMDGDGDLDAFLVQSGDVTAPPGANPPSRLFRNRGDGTFDDVTGGSGADVRRYGMGVAAGDCDNDGDTDLYVTAVGPNVLLRNDGGGRFTDVTQASGTGDPGWGTSSGFLDYDNDGDLDLVVANYLNWSPAGELDCYNDLTGAIDYCSPGAYRAPSFSVLYRNDGGGTFTDVSEAAGIRARAGTGLGVLCGDVDGDGFTDILVANDGMMNHLWMNRGDGRFTESALAAGCAVDEGGLAKAGMGIAAADIDGDADLDFLVVNLRGQSDSLYRNLGGYFADATARSGIGPVSRPFTRFGAGWYDFDNDGALDLYEANGKVMRDADVHAEDPFAEPNLLFRGTASGRFEEVRPRGGTRPLLLHTSRAAAFGDVDNDGGIDVLVANRDAPPCLLRNVAPGRGNWIMLRVLDEHGRDALGATVTMRAGDRTITADVRSAASYCAANDPRIHAGLGPETRLTAVSVRWPDGTRESFGDLPAGAVHTLRRGTGTPLP